MTIDAIQLTGGGKLTDKQNRVINGPLYQDVASKLGISASGHLPRFDSDSTSPSTVEPASKRSKYKLDLNTRGVGTSQKCAPTTSANPHNTNLMVNNVTHTVTNLVTDVANSDQLEDDSNDLEMKILQSQLERDEIVKEKEEIENEMMKIELTKAQALVDEEIKHKKTMMKLVEEAERLKVERSKQK